MIKKIIVFVFLLSFSTFNQKYHYVDKEINIFKNIEVKKKNELVLKTYQGNITAYGPDCKGCIGITASGYNVRYGNIYYQDKEYGKIRIVAADKSLPFGTIIRIKNLKQYKDPNIEIVIERGSAIGFNKNVYINLLYKNERETNTFGKQKATFEILRRGY